MPTKKKPTDPEVKAKEIVAEEIDDDFTKAVKSQDHATRAIMVRDFASPHYNLKTGQDAPPHLAATLVTAQAAKWVDEYKDGGKVEDRKLPK